jgi:hypothetical protein
MSQEVHQGCGRQRTHRIQGQASSEEIDAYDDAKSNNCNPNPPIEIFLDIQGVMAAGYTGCDEALGQYGVIHENGKVSFAIRTDNVFCR